MPKDAGDTNDAKVKLTIEFDNQAALRHFALWLCDSGEQQYWDWMQYRERQEAGVITVTGFRYHGIEDTTKVQNDPARYGAFMADNTIRTECGRLDDDDGSL